MCGLIGAITRHSISIEKVKTVLSQMKYRGPDSTGTAIVKFKYGYITLGFNRLAIQDLSEVANQPFTKNDITILLNGEIYNKIELRELLFKKHDVFFITDSDTEVALEGYFHFGENFISRLRGMFALVIVDHKKQKVFIYRDRFGIKPIYILKNIGDLYFSSDIKSLIYLSGNDSINLDYFARNLLLDPFVGYDESTAFENIFSLLPGSYLEIDIDGIVHQHQYYRISDVLINNEVINQSAVRKLFMNSVSEHLLSDVPVGCALSGGFDSSLISVIARQESESCKLFFTIDLGKEHNIFKDDPFHGKLVYNTFDKDKTEFIPVQLNIPWSLETIDLLIQTLGSPLYDNRTLVWYNFYNEVKKHCTVLLNGQGADELWYGYYPKIWNWFSNLFHEDFNSHSIRQYFTNRKNNSAVFGLLSSYVYSRFDYFVQDVIEKILSSTKESNNHKKITLFMVKTVLASLLNFEDATSMLSSVEVRVPFLDHRFVEMALSLDSEAHLGSTKKGKDFLKKAFNNYLPSEVIEREKSPLPKPLDVGIVALYDKHFDEISSSSLVRELYEWKQLNNFTKNKTQGFYGTPSEAMVQIISTWRFGEFYGI